MKEAARKKALRLGGMAFGGAGYCSFLVGLFSSEGGGKLCSRGDNDDFYTQKHGNLFAFAFA